MRIVKGALAGVVGAAAMRAFLDRAGAQHEVHHSYGAAWGVYFAVVQSVFRPPYALHGTFIAGLMTVVAVKVIPRLGLAPEPRTREELLTSAASHLVYGWATALACWVLSLGRRG